MPVSPRTEQWQDVAGTDLQVSTLGRARRHGEMVHTVNGRVGLGGRGKSVAIAHLVLWTFVGPCPDGMECCHYDDDRSNNALSNLRWDTHSGNMQDRSRNGYNPSRGGEHGRSKLTVESVQQIRQLHNEGWTYTAIANKFDVTRRTVFMVVTRITWGHIQ